MNDKKLFMKYKKLFLNSDVFLNWNEEFRIVNSDFPLTFVAAFVKNKKNLIGFKISILKNEKDISVFWQGVDDKFFELNDEGFYESLETITEQLKKYI